jgi:hypothetical protein
MFKQSSLVNEIVRVLSKLALRENQTDMKQNFWFEMEGFNKYPKKYRFLFLFLFEQVFINILWL